MRRAITALAIGIALAIPAQASAATTKQVTAIVKKGFTRQIRARATLAGYKYIGDTMKCAAIGGQRWTCYATYTLGKQGAFAKYGVYITTTGDTWRTIGNGTLLKEW